MNPTTDTPPQCLFLEVSVMLVALNCKWWCCSMLCYTHASQSQDWPTIDQNVTQCIYKIGKIKSMEWGEKHITFLEAKVFREQQAKFISNYIHLSWALWFTQLNKLHLLSIYLQYSVALVTKLASSSPKVSQSPRSDTSKGHIHLLFRTSDSTFLTHLINCKYLSRSIKIPLKRDVSGHGMITCW